MTPAAATTAPVQRALVLAPGARALVLATLESCASPAEREACGVLLGRRDRSRWMVERAVELPNVAPDADRFAIDPAALAGVLRAPGAGPGELIGFWHTHPAAPAVPSRADRAGCWDGHVLLVAGGRGDLRAWWPVSGGFEECSIAGADR